jgi:hypothetical protein
MRVLFITMYAAVWQNISIFSTCTCFRNTSIKYALYLRASVVADILPEALT